jgi:hypothetical protein
MYFENQNSQIGDGICNVGWSTGDGFADIMAGSALAATIESHFAPPGIRVWYRDQAQKLQRIKFDNVWGSGK